MIGVFFFYRLQSLFGGWGANEKAFRIRKNSKREKEDQEGKVGLYSVLGGFKTPKIKDFLFRSGFFFE